MRMVECIQVISEGGVAWRRTRSTRAMPRREFPAPRIIAYTFPCRRNDALLQFLTKLLLLAFSPRPEFLEETLKLGGNLAERLASCVLPQALVVAFAPCVGVFEALCGVCGTVAAEFGEGVGALGEVECEPEVRGGVECGAGWGDAGDVVV